MIPPRRLDSKNKPDRAKIIRKFSDNLGTPPKISETKMDPQGWRRALKRLSISDMAERLAQASIQGVVIRLVKKLNGHMPDVT